MPYVRHKMPLNIFELGDLVPMFFSFIVGAAVVYDQTPNSFESLPSMRIKVQNVIIFCLFIYLV